MISACYKVTIAIVLNQYSVARARETYPLYRQCMNIISTVIMLLDIIIMLNEGDRMGQDNRHVVTVTVHDMSDQLSWL